MTSEDFTKEVLPLQNKVFRFAKRLMRGPVEAEDITQDVFAKLWTKKEMLRTVRSVEAFAMTIARNMCFDTLRSAKNKTADLTEVNSPSHEDHPLHHAEMADGLEVMNAIVDRLPEKQKMIVQLRDIEGYEFKEIAEITGMSVNAIKVNLSRARQKVRAELTKAFDYGLNTH